MSTRHRLTPAGSGLGVKLFTIKGTRHSLDSMTDNRAIPKPEHPLRRILEQRIAIIDGAMGTTIRTYGMKEADIRGERFRDAKRTC